MVRFKLGPGSSAASFALSSAFLPCSARRYDSAHRMPAYGPVGSHLEWFHPVGSSPLVYAEAVAKPSVPLGSARLAWGACLCLPVPFRLFSRLQDVHEPRQSAAAASHGQLCEPEVMKLNSPAGNGRADRPLQISDERRLLLRHSCWEGTAGAWIPQGSPWPGWTACAEVQLAHGRARAPRSPRTTLMGC